MTLVWKNQLGYTTKNTAYVQSNIQEWENLLKKRLSSKKECVDRFQGIFVGKYQVCDSGHNTVKYWSIKSDNISR